MAKAKAEAVETAADVTESAPNTILYKYKVEITNLNIRKGAGKNFDVTGNFTGVGTFDISEIKQGEGSVNGWGKLADGRGWISLDYAKPV